MGVTMGVEESPSAVPPAAPAGTKAKTDEPLSPGMRRVPDTDAGPPAISAAGTAGMAARVAVGVKGSMLMSRSWSNSKLLDYYGENYNPAALSGRECSTYPEPSENININSNAVVRIITIACGTTLRLSLCHHASSGIPFVGRTDGNAARRTTATTTTRRNVDETSSVCSLLVLQALLPPGGEHPSSRANGHHEEARGPMNNNNDRRGHQAPGAAATKRGGYYNAKLTEAEAGGALPSERGNPSIERGVSYPDSMLLDGATPARQLTTSSAANYK
eukprot:1185085-Prorocentrum_minimum.AAC.4